MTAPALSIRLQTCGVRAGRPSVVINDRGLHFFGILVAMAADADRLKIIADNIERLYQAMRRAAGNIAGLLQVGQATCEEVRAYNLWALATYNTQRGMLATLRANGETGVPELPAAPTLFTWKGVSGDAAWQINCGAQGLSGLGSLKAAMKPPQAQARRLSTNEIQIVTQDPHVFDPERAPSFSTLLQVQSARTQAGMNGLGVFPVILIVIAGIAIAVSVAVAAIMKYLETSEVQESNSKQVALQADAFANYTAARLECLKTCTGKGGKTEDCVDTCAKLIQKPQITLPGQGRPWGWLQWTGFTVVAGLGAMLAVKIVQRRMQGRSVFELPSGY